MVKYKPKDKPTVTNDMYIKNRRTLVARIPKRSANLEDTLKPCRSKKCRTEWINFITLFFSRYKNSHLKLNLFLTSLCYYTFGKD